MFKIILALCLFGLAYAQYGHDDHKDVDFYTVPHYKFDYSVHDPHTHDFKEQHEERKDHLTKGHYSLKEPHGNTRSLHYVIESSKHH